MKSQNEPRVSNWLFAMSLGEYGFVLNEKQLLDAVSLLYAKELIAFKMSLRSGI